MFPRTLINLFTPLASRKVRIALAGLIAAIAAEQGFHLGEEAVLSILAMASSLILGIAIEDAGAKSATRSR